MTMKKIADFVMRYINSLLHCLFLFSIGIFFAKYRAILNKINNDFEEPKKSDPQPKAIIPEIEIAKIVSDFTSIQIKEPIIVNGNISLLEMIVMNKIINIYSPINLFEIGTFDGRTTLNMAANCPKSAKVHTLDLPKENLDFTKLPIVSRDRQYIDKKFSGNVYRGTDVEHKISQLYGDSALFDFSPFNNTMDFVFIDGSHSYEYALNDLMKAIKMLRNNRGIILWHDYNSPYWYGVTRALNELYEKNIEFKQLAHIKGTSFACLILA